MIVDYIYYIAIVLKYVLLN